MLAVSSDKRLHASHFLWEILQKGKGLRAKAAMNNHAEQFQFFAVAVVLNLVVRGPSGDSVAVRIYHSDSVRTPLNISCPSPQVAVAAGLHAACRLLHLVTYIHDKPWWRSTAFSLGSLANLALYGFAFAPDL
jgi:uncharacterized MAPEG superfamily protein